MTMENRTLLSSANKAAPLEGLGKALNRSKNLLKCVYDFSVLGGAQGAITLLDDEGNEAKLPDNAIITRAYLDILTAVTSGGSATVSLDSQNAGDLLSATAVADLGAGLLECAPDGNLDTAIKLSADKKIKATVATADLIGGKFNLFIEFLVSD